MEFLTELVQLVLKVKKVKPKKVKGRLVPELLLDYSAAPYEFVELVQDLEYRLESILFGLHSGVTDPADVQKLQARLFESGILSMSRPGKFRVSIDSVTYVLVTDPWLSTVA